MGGLKALLHSEKALALGLLVIASTIMVFTGQIAPEAWMDYTKFLAVTYVGGKTIQGAVSAVATKRNGSASAQPPA